MIKDYTTVIDANSSNIYEDLKELFRYKDLIVLFVKRNFTLMYKQTILGPLWIILNPLLTSVIFTFIFGEMAGFSTDGIPHFLFYMTSNTVWGLFSTSITGTANTFTANAGLFGKVYFPRLTIPVAQVITALVNFGIQFSMLICAAIIYAVTGWKIEMTVYLLMLPILLLQCMLLAISVGIIVSSLTTKYRDLAIAVGFGVQLWMYCSPVVYSLSAMGGKIGKILLINPMTPIIENFRFALFGTGELMIWPWVFSMIITGVLMIIGVLIFNKVEKTFMDTV